MNITIYKANERGYFNHGWLKTSHIFSFAEYHNPKRMRFGLLRVLNDDWVEPEMGFGTHPHKNMEIVSIPLYGSLAHKDSEGNEQVINTGEIQIMSAGTGVTHSEYNSSESEKVNFLQIWIFPKIKDIRPKYDQISVSEEELNRKFRTVVSPVKQKDNLQINQDAYLSIGNFIKGVKVNYEIKKEGNGLFIFLIDGKIKIDRYELSSRDSTGIENTDKIEIDVLEKSKILLIEVPMN